MGFQGGVRTEAKGGRCLTEVRNKEVVDGDFIVKWIINLKEVGGGQTGWFVVKDVQIGTDYCLGIIILRSKVNWFGMETFGLNIIEVAS